MWRVVTILRLYAVVYGFSLFTASHTRLDNTCHAVIFVFMIVIPLTSHFRLFAHHWLSSLRATLRRFVKRRFGMCLFVCPFPLVNMINSWLIFSNVFSVRFSKINFWLNIWNSFNLFIWSRLIKLEPSDVQLALKIKFSMGFRAHENLILSLKLNCRQ